MPSRPADRSPLGLDVAPTPGNTTLLADTEGDDFRRMSDEANQVDMGLNAVLRAAGSGGFIGQTAQAAPRRQDLVVPEPAARDYHTGAAPPTTGAASVNEDAEVAEDAEHVESLTLHTAGGR